MKPLRPAPAESPHRHDMRPPPPPPRIRFSRSWFSAAGAADLDVDPATAGKPSVMLLEWWLAPVEGDAQKVGVAGSFKRNYTLYELSPAPIVKRHAPNILESEDGNILLLSGFLNNTRMLGNGFSKTVCEHFMVGFPRCWQSCNLLYPNLTNSDTGCQPCSSNTSNYGVEHLDSYRTSFISKHSDGLKSSSNNDSVFPKSSHLSNGTPRTEEHTCDGNVATNENAAASSEAGKEGQRTPAVTLEVRGFHEDTQHLALTEKAVVDEEMPNSVYLDVQNTFSLSNGTPTLEENTCDGDIPTNEDAATSNDGNERHTAPSKEVNNVEMGLIAGSPSSDRGNDDIATDVSLAPTVQCTDNAVSEAAGSTSATVACLTNQGPCWGNQPIASNKKPVGRSRKQTFPHEKRQSATRSHWTRSAVSHGKSSLFAARLLTLETSSQPFVHALDQKYASTGGLSHPLSPTCSATLGSIAGSPSSQRGHGDIATDVSLAPTVQCTDNAVSEAVDSTPAPGRTKTPVACLKNQGSLGGNQHIASNKKPVGRPRKQTFPHEKCQSATRSHWTRSAVSHEKHASTGGLSCTLQSTCSAILGSIAGSPSNERGHDDIATDVSLAPTAQCTDNAICEAVDSTPATDRKKTPVKNQGSSGVNKHIASNKKPVGRSKKQIFPHENSQSATRSHGSRSPLSHVLWSPLTRSKAMLLSMSTPEDLKRSRSGRVIVPQLDQGCQSIVYGKDGSIAGVIGLHSPAMSKGELKTYYRRKKRRTE